MSITDIEGEAKQASQAPVKVGYGSPPEHSRFKPGQSGNPSGRAKGSENLKTLFNRILDEEISLRDGADVKKVSKAEALMRGVVVGALKGDPRNMAMLFRFPASTCALKSYGPRTASLSAGVIITGNTSHVGTL